MIINQMSYKLIKKHKNGIRIGELETAHGKIETPFFMPVGTVGSVKTLTSNDLKGLDAQIVLSNTYHLYLRPGEQLIKNLGGLHSFMKWDGPILTDSGGYQVFSLAKNNDKLLISNIESNAESQNPNRRGGLVKIIEEGVEFTSHLDGSKHLFTPEKVIDIQLDLGVDILMPLDVCPSGKATKKEVEEACRITINWARRAKEHFDKEIEIRYQKSGKTRPLLHGIVQGGLYPDLRKWCAEELIKLDFDGYSVGGLAVDNETRDMWDTVKLMGELLPENKQRYLMGVGTPDDIVKAVQLGMDMFDCVLPTRMARHANIYVKCNTKLDLESDHNYELVNLLRSQYRNDPEVIDNECGCEACQNGQGYSKAYLSHLLRSKEITGLRLATLHNLWQYLDLMKKIKKVNF